MMDSDKSKVRLSIVIVNYNVKYYLEQCLISLQASDIASLLEIIVVDNNSSDGSREYFAGAFPDVRFIWNTQNVGFAKATNQGIRQSQGQYVLLLNPDTVVGEHVLSRACDFMDAHPDAGALGVKMINGCGKFLPESKRGFPSPWASFCKIFGLTRFFPRSPVLGKYHLLYLDENKVHQIDILCGAFMLMRAETLTKTGLLDETFFMYGEDIDLSYRVTLSGYRNYYVPEKIIHYKGESTKKDSIRYVKIFYEAMYIFFRKHYPRSGFFFSLMVPVGIFTRAFMAAMRRMFPFAYSKKKKVHVDQKQLFDLDHYSFEQIIDIIDRREDKSVAIQIYSPQSGMIISSSNYYNKKNGHVGD
jgi:GT2 family glycosyltransferase